MKTKLLALLLAVMMVVALVPMAVVSAAGADSDIKWLTHGVDNCFQVILANGTVKGTYKTLPQADGALEDGAKVVMLGNVKYVDLTSYLNGKDRYYWGFNAVPQRTGNKAGITWSFDGQGYIIQVEVQSAKTGQDKWAWSFGDTGSFVNEKVTWENLTLITNAGGMLVGSGASTEGYAVFNNVKVYAGYSYHTVDPTVYSSLYEGFVYPTTYQAAPGDHTTGFYNMNYGLGFNKAQYNVSLTDCEIVARCGPAVNFATYVVANNSAFISYGPQSAPNYDGAVVRINANGEGAFNNCKVYSDWCVDVTQGGKSGWDNVAMVGFRLYDNAVLHINGGYYETPGNVVHLHSNGGQYVSINGGTFVLPDIADTTGEHHHVVRVIKNARVAISGATLITEHENATTFVTTMGANCVVSIEDTVCLAKKDAAAKMTAVLGELTATGAETISTVYIPAVKDENKTWNGYYVCHGEVKENKVVSYADKWQGYGKDLTNGTRANAKVHGVDECFAVTDAAGEEVGRYTTWADAWNAMASTGKGATLKLLGNVHATDYAANAISQLKTTGSYTIDGQGYILDFEIKEVKAKAWQDALYIRPVTGQCQLTINDLAIISDAGCLRFNGSTGNFSVIMNDVQMYADDGYYLVDPDYYPVDFVRPDTLYKAADAPANGYQLNSALYINNAANRVIINGEDSVFYAHGPALRCENAWLVVNGGLIKSDGQMYATDRGDGTANTQQDGAAIWAVWSNSRIFINNAALVATLDQNEPNEDGTPGAGALGMGMRIETCRRVVVNGGEFYSTGASIHHRKSEDATTGSINTFIHVNGGIFTLLNAENTDPERTSGMLVSNENNTGTARGVFTVTGGVFVNQRKSLPAFAATTTATAKKTVFNLFDGLFLSKVLPISEMKYVEYKGMNATPTTIVERAVVDPNKTMKWNGAEYYICRGGLTADENVSELAPVTQKGAAMLLDATQNGIRFTSTVKATADATYGTLIVPTDYAMAALARFGNYNKESLLAVADNKNYVVDVAATGDNLVDNGDGTYTMYAPLVGKGEITTLTLTAIAYTVVDGETYYGAVAVGDASRSISDVAKRAMYDCVVEADTTYKFESIYNEELGIKAYSVYTAEEQLILKNSMSVLDEAITRAMLEIYLKPVVAE